MFEACLAVLIYSAAPQDAQGAEEEDAEALRTNQLEVLANDARNDPWLVAAQGDQAS